MVFVMISFYTSHDSIHIILWNALLESFSGMFLMLIHVTH